MCSCVCACVCTNPIFICSSVNGHLGYFRVLAVVNSAAVKIGVHVSFWITVFSGYVPRNGIAGSCGNAIFNFLRNHHTIFHSSHSILHSQPQGTRVPISPRLCQHLFSVFFCFDSSHPDGFEVVSHWGFDSVSWWYWASFHVLIAHLYTFFAEIQVLCPFLISFFVVINF